MRLLVCGFIGSVLAACCLWVAWLVVPVGDVQLDLDNMDETWIGEYDRDATDLSDTNEYRLTFVEDAGHVEVWMTQSLSAPSNEWTVCSTNIVFRSRFMPVIEPPGTGSMWRVTFREVGTPLILDACRPDCRCQFCETARSEAELRWFDMVQLDPDLTNRWSYDYTTGVMTAKGGGK